MPRLMRKLPGMEKREHSQKRLAEGTEPGACFRQRDQETLEKSVIQSPEGDESQ